jgi:chromosome segregation ATPase
MAPIAASINSMGERVANTNAEALERMVAAFTKELGGATLRYNEQLAEILRETKDALAAAPQQILKAATLTEEMLDVAADKTRSALEVAGVAFTATADKLAAIAVQAQRAEERLDVALDKATANADAATARLTGLAEQAQQATTTADAATARMAGLAGQVEKATTTAGSALKEASAMGAAFTEARLAAEAMQTDTRDWRDGMGEVDRNVSTIIEKIRGLLPEDPGPSSTEPPKASPWGPKPSEDSSEAAE